MKVNSSLALYSKQNKKNYVAILKAIKSYSKIAIFRHINPDFDALGAQIGLADFIKENFKEKDVICLGDNHVSFTPRIYREMDKPTDDWFKEPYLAIIVDVHGAKRTADPRFKNADKIIVIDHHDEDDKPMKSDIFFNDPIASAASEVIADMLLFFERKYKLIVSKECAKNLYSGIVGDSGRFLYSNTKVHTFAVAEELIKKNITLVDIYNEMYEKTLNDLRCTSFILDHYKVTKNGCAYYVLENKDLLALDIPVQKGKDNVNIFSNVKGINAWCSITEDITEPCFRISIRSKEKDMTPFAKRYGGGGHPNAAGAKIKDLSELDKFISDLDEFMND